MRHCGLYGGRPGPTLAVVFRRVTLTTTCADCARGRCHQASTQQFVSLLTPASLLRLATERLPNQPPFYWSVTPVPEQSVAFF